MFDCSTVSSGMVIGCGDGGGGDDDTGLYGGGDGDAGL